MAPFRIVAADVLGHVTLAKRSQPCNILVISDLYTKYAVAVSLKDTTAKTVATTSFEEWFLKFWAPDNFHTDQGTNFNSEAMKDVCRVFMIDKTRNSPYHPQGIGQVERINRMIADTISKVLYLGEYLPKRPERIVRKTLRDMKKSRMNPTHPTKKPRIHRIINPTSAEIQANRNRPHVSFHDVPRMINTKNDEEVSLINCLLYLSVPEPSVEFSFPVYEEINESSNTPPPPDDEDHESDRSASLMIGTTWNC